jgi:hypothetical protein
MWGVTDFVLSECSLKDHYPWLAILLLDLTSERRPIPQKWLEG